MKQTISHSQLLNRILLTGRLRQFQIIVQVAELGSMHRASRELGVSQPAITKTIRELEEKLELPLFERQPRGIKLTAAGREVMPYLRRMLEAAGRCAETVAVRHNNGSAIVRVASVAAGTGGLLAPYVEGFTRAYPDVQMKIDEIDGRQIGAFASQDDYDVFVCRAPETIPEAWTFLPMLADQNVIIGSVQHPLAKRSDVSLDDLAACAWLIPPAGVSAVGLFETLFQDSLPPSTCRVETRVPVLIRAILDQRNLLSIVPLSMFRSEIDEGRLSRIPFDLGGSIAPLGLMIRREQAGEAARRLIDYLTVRASLRSK